MCGVTLTVAGEVRLGAGQGELVAMIVPIALATAFTASRDLSIGEVWLGYALAGLLTATVQLGAAAPFSLSYADVWLMLLMVTVVGGMSFMLIGIGPRHLRPAEVGLLMLLETTFGPLWVWVGIGEVPSALAFVGGAIVLATLVLYSLSALRAERARVPPIEAVRVTP
ncbi:MAG: hypothetical protein ACFB3T_06280 [Geminicoccaceae bacterium]